MNRLELEFTNELGNRIEMNVIEDDRGITVSATGPTSKVEHTWTIREASALFTLLSDAGMYYINKWPNGPMK